ncbi:MAG: CopG family transcriptional regulator [Saprospiraceae bacterium]
MTTYTSTLPENLIENLNKMAKSLNVPKNKIIEHALQKYLEQLERQMYIRSYLQLENDSEILSMAEEGMEFYEEELRNWDETR